MQSSTIQPPLGMCSCIAQLTNEVGYLMGGLQPAQAAAQCQQSFLTRRVLGMEGCCGSWLLFATKTIQISVRIYTFLK